MARKLKLGFGGTVVEAELAAKVDKKSLYGFARRVVEHDGRRLMRGTLGPDGRLWKAGAIVQVKADPEGSVVEEPVTEVGGEPAVLQPSSFEIESPLEPVEIECLVGFNVRDVYPLTLSGLPMGLYRTTFAYRKSYRPHEAFVLVRDDAAFLLTGTSKSSAMVGLAVVYDFFDAAGNEEEEAGEELDFAMM